MRIQSYGDSAKICEIPTSKNLMREYYFIYNPIENNILQRFLLDLIS